MIGLSRRLNNPRAPGNANSMLDRSWFITCTRVSTKSLRARHIARSALVSG